MRYLFYFALSTFFSCSCTDTAPLSQAIHNGHAHNDYEHERPLFDALKYGFRSIEVDVHAWNDQLIVAHDSTDFRTLPNIMDLYIYPLDSLLKHRLISKKSLPLILMVDLKTKKEEALHLLNILTQSRREIFYSVDKKSGPIQILISGDPPLDLLEQLNNPYLFIDGRFDREYPNQLQKQVTRISGKFFSLFGHVNGDEREKLIKDHLIEAHSNNQEVRFWGTKDHPDTWDELHMLNVDWIGTDDLEGFYSWSKSKQ